MSLPSRLESFWMGVIAGVIGTLAFVPLPAKADWLSVTVASYHANRDRGYNEFNYGIGYERTLSDKWRFAAGVYENSYYRTSWYAVGVRELYTIGRWKFGAAIGAVTGYTAGRADPVLAPILAWEGKTFGVNFFPVSPKVVGLQLKMRF